LISLVHERIFEDFQRILVIYGKVTVAAGKQLSPDVIDEDLARDLNDVERYIQQFPF
jgi:hypothetical protein